MTFLLSIVCVLSVNRSPLRLQITLWYLQIFIRDRPFNLKVGGGDYGFFVSFRNLFSDNTRVRIFFFFHNLTLGYMTKTLNQIIFFSSTKIRICFSATLGIRIFFWTTQELEYIFFQNIILGYMTKIVNQIIFFSSTKIRIFFSATLGIRIFF